MNENSVIFKGYKGGISIILDNNISFEIIEKTLLKKTKNAKEFFEGANISISFRGRELSDNEENLLLDIISKESGLSIAFVNNIAMLNPILEDKKSSLENNKNKNDASHNTDYPIENLAPLLMNISNKERTYFHKGSIRGGQKINFSGSVVVIGDVNPSGQIIAEGNIIVLGKLKGMAHAGCTGDINCFISSLYLTPTQLIIGDCLAYFPTDIERKILPEYAYVKDGQIFVESLINV